jgi:hypothetical protein
VAGRSGLKTETLIFNNDQKLTMTFQETRPIAIMSDMEPSQQLNQDSRNNFENIFPNQQDRQPDQ